MKGGAFRFLGGKRGAVIEIKFPPELSDLAVSYLQEKRQSTISTNLATLRKLIQHIGSARASNSGGNPKECIRITQKYKRSKITVNLLERTTGTSNTSSEGYSLVINTGASEHIYLSADLPVGSISEIQYDETTKTFAESEKPSKFFVGINYRFGDLLSEKNSSVDRIIFKAMISAQSRPLESYGIGLGYSLDNFDIFVARIRSRPGAQDGVRPDATYSTTAGISFSIDKAISWVSGE